MPFEFQERTKGEGEWASMRDLMKMEEELDVTGEFLTDDPTNTYEGKPAPGNIINATAVSSGEKVSTRSRYGGSRDDKLLQMQEYLRANPGAILRFKFVKLQGTAYIGIELVEELPADAA